MMRKGEVQLPARKLPSLVDLCVQKIIDNIRYLGNVGCVDLHLLERILPHCTVDQLMHVEKASEGADLSPVTDKLWKGFFEKQYGSNCSKEVMRRMREKKVSFKWKQLYEAKQKEIAEAEKEVSNRIRNLYKKEDAKKQSRQVQLCTKTPPSSKKRFWGDGPGYNVSNLKSNIMKKSKIEFLKSHEMKNLAVMKKNTFQRTSSVCNTFTGANSLFNKHYKDWKYFWNWFNIKRSQIHQKDVLGANYVRDGNAMDHYLLLNCNVSFSYLNAKKNGLLFFVVFIA
ncbi:hypothetical protein Ahy_B01g051501 isoform C [Arachis hypogaea]|uniref:Elongin-A n=1 Tax=Arachis hypogaea TaxID=3818 RepID=A0A445AMA9_ARAHY|nr:hypothetical protein Ahy_B01g051501 isoform A [Arachis hypogaea]RYR27471.1 hypothetical protein Ahy_B01g051501 isoform B [Arachis hypogaea]RYR27472.1 hypothetical protein Ahy_B01g051501 isoform C [Arachis hypogaea]